MEQSLTTKQLVDMYLEYATELAQCQRIAKAFKFKLPLNREIIELYNMPYLRSIVVSKLFLDLKRITYHLDLLNREIERRTRLVGFM